MIFIYYESTKRKLKTKNICGCRCYERLQTKTKEFTRLSYTELLCDLEAKKKGKRKTKILCLLVRPLRTEALVLGSTCARGVL